MVVDLAAGDDRGLLVHELHQVADQPGLGLASFAEQDEIVAGEDPSLERRKHGIVEPDHAGEQRLTLAQLRQEVVAKLLLQRPVGVAGRAELADRGLHRGQDYRAPAEA
jgi:hypothetical protein